MLADEITADLRGIKAQAIADATSGIAGTFLDEDFNSGTGGFVYNDVTFNGTSNPGYASGSHVDTPGVPGDKLVVVTLGNIDNATILDMSGGWSATFQVSAATSATLTTQFHIIQAPDYESDEFSDALIAVNGITLPRLGRVTGNGNGGGFRTLGPATVSVPISLVAGSNTVTIGGYSNKKTFNNEYTEVRYNFITIEGAGGAPDTASLDSKGINYGFITVDAAGTVDDSNVEGVDLDLRVKPFFHDGRTISMREFIIGALNDEMGIQVVDPVLCDVDNGIARVSPAGFVFDPGLDDFSAPAECNPNNDTDNDGVFNELDAALVDHMEFYLLNYLKPGQYKTDPRTDQGLALMSTIGCTDCHIQNLTINVDRRVADVETNYDPNQGIYNEMFAVANGSFVDDNSDPNPENHTRLPAFGSFTVENIFTDLKRHDLGPFFHERDNDGSRFIQHITEPLWGVGSTAPYGHDGRSINLDQVILRHGGEAQAARDAYKNLSSDDQAMIREFLQTLVLFPPDDTASNLNMGIPGADPQIPANHGNIALGVLFTTSVGKE